MTIKEITKDIVSQVNTAKDERTLLTLLQDAVSELKLSMAAVIAKEAAAVAVKYSGELGEACSLGGLSVIGKAGTDKGIRIAKGQPSVAAQQACRAASKATAKDAAAVAALRLTADGKDTPDAAPRPVVYCIGKAWAAPMLTTLQADKAILWDLGTEAWNALTKDEAAACRAAIANLSWLMAAAKVAAPADAAAEEADGCSIALD